MTGGLALAAGGFTVALAAKYHKEIGEALGPVVEQIGEKVKEMASQATAMIEKLKETASKAALSLGEYLKTSIINFTGINETKAKMAGGEGFLQARELPTGDCPRLVSTMLVKLKDDRVRVVSVRH